MTQDPIDPLVAFAELGRTKLTEAGLDDVLNRVAAVARRALPGATEVSITLLRDDRPPYTAAYTGALALELDERQYEQRRGPCLQAAAEQTTISVPDTANDTRWAGWAPHAAAVGAGSVLSVGLPLLDEVSGALNIYGRRPTALDAAVAPAQSFAGYAAVRLADAYVYHSAVDLSRQLQAAMDSRAVIEQAKGIVMAERRCSPDEAFAVLAAVSQNTNRKVRDVAVALVASTQR